MLAISYKLPLSLGEFQSPRQPSTIKKIIVMEKFKVMATGTRSNGNTWIEIQRDSNNHIGVLSAFIQVRPENTPQVGEEIELPLEFVKLIEWRA